MQEHNLAEKPELEFSFVNLNKVAALAIMIMWCITMLMMFARGLEFRPLILVFPVAAGFMYLVGRRIAKFKVLELYADYLVFTPSEFTQPQRVEYANIDSLRFKHWFAHLKVRQPDGSLKENPPIPLLRVPRRQRQAARQALVAKMEAFEIPVID